MGDKFLPLIKDESRYQAVYGGSGSGKSYYAAINIMTRALSRKQRFLVARKVGNTLKNSVFKLFCDLRSQYDLASVMTVNKSDLSFTFLNGSEIITSGLDDVEKLKSIQGITGIWVEEATELERNDMDQLDLRLRGETPDYKQIILTFNPISETHWLRTFIDVPGVCVHHSTYLDNPFIDNEYRKVLNDRISYDPNLARIYIRGEWGIIRTGAEYYPMFDYKKTVTPLSYENAKYLHVSFDQNVVPYITALCGQVEKVDNTYVLKIIKEFTLKNPFNKTEPLCRKILETYPDPSGIFYYGDASGNKRDTRNAYSDYDIVDRVFRKFLSNTSNRVKNHNIPHAKRRPFMNKVLAGAIPSIKLLIDPGCKELIADLESVKEDADGSKLKEVFRDKSIGISYEKHGHTSDALDYLVTSIFGKWM